MIGQQHQRGGDRAQQPRAGPAVAQPRPEAFRDRLACAGRRGPWAAGAGAAAALAAGQAVHHAGDDVPPGREDSRRVELQPERIGRRHRRDDHLEPLERQRPCGQSGLRGPPRRQRRGPGLPRFPRGPELTGPEQLGDLLEGAADREAGGVQAAETEAIAGDLGDGRLDRDVRGPGGPPRPPPAGQPLDLVRVEEAGPPVGGLAAAEHTAADIRVERGGLDAEPPGGLGGGQGIGHAPSRFVRDN